MFADLGHFSYSAIQVHLWNLDRHFDTWCLIFLCILYFPILPSQIAFTFLVYPALILAYMGQAAYLSKNHQMADQISYYVSVPGI